MAETAKKEQVKRATCWDPLHVQVADVESKSELLGKTVDMVTASNSPPGLVFLLNTGELLKTKETAHWPGFRLMRSQHGIVAQAQTSLEVKEFQGIETQSIQFSLFRFRGRTQ